jgi:hypothetical protein
MENNLIITPKTKVFSLIETYPQLEAVLISFVPAFEKLKNPVLRNTVARITTLQQAAAIGNVPIGDLINRLRKEVGQDIMSAATSTEYNTVQPAWFDDKLVEQESDARVMLAAGEQPVNQVMADLNSLQPGSIYKLTAPFLPAPLIDKATGLGLDHWLKKIDEELFIIYFFRK